MMNNPLVSIVTPCYNSESYIEECILSIKNQTYGNVEHIIVDGGSTDSTLAILKKYQDTYNMRWISEKDNGMYDAISKGFSMAQGEVFAWLNSDDKYMPWTCEVIANVFSKSTVQWCTGVPCLYTERGIAHHVPRIMPVYPRKWIEKGYFDGRVAGFIQQESTFWSRDLWEKNKEVIGKYKYAGDYHLWRAFAKTQNLYTVDSILSGFRVHAGQKSENLEAYYKEIEPLSCWGAVLKKLKVIEIMKKLEVMASDKLVIRAGAYLEP